MSGFSWKEKAEEGATSEAMPEGYHYVTCVKVQRGTKKTADLRSSAGDPQIMTVWANDAGQEAVVYFTLSEKASVILASMLKHSGANLEAMDHAGVTLDRFEDEKFAETQLLNRKCWCWAEQSGKYTNLSFVSESDAKATHGNGNAQQQPDGYAGKGYQDNPGAIEDSDIPF